MTLGHIPYRLDIYELLNRTSSQIVLMAAASRLAQKFRIVLSPKVKIKKSKYELGLFESIR